MKFMKTESQRLEALDKSKRNNRQRKGKGRRAFYMKDPSLLSVSTISTAKTFFPK